MMNAPLSNYTKRLTKGTETVDFVVSGTACMWATGDLADSCSRAEAELTISQLIANGWSVAYSDVHEAA